MFSVRRGPYSCLTYCLTCCLNWNLLVVLSAVAAAGSGFGDFENARSDSFPRVERSSFYVTMSDGVRLAVDLYLPAPRTSETRLPALVTQTRYWRRAQLSKLLAEQPLPFEESYFARKGYAVLHVDVRGTGASFGTRSGPWGPAEVRDNYDLVNWIIDQPWSDGGVGAYGTSYSGTSAALMAAAGHPAVKVASPAFNEFDVYTDIAYPGGVFHDNFVREWAGANDVLDRNQTPRAMFGLAGSLAVKGVAPVDGGDGKLLLRQAVKEHESNADVFMLARGAVFRDRGLKGQPTIESFSLHRLRDQLGSKGAFLDFWGSWLDAGTAHAALTEILSVEYPSVEHPSFKHPARAVIGPWSHGAGHHASPFLPADVRSAGGGLSQLAEQVRLFDHYLKGASNGFDAEPRIVYYTLGEEQWKSTDEWPPTGLESSSYFLSEGGRLAPEPAAGTGEMEYDVDFTATSGTSNRWYTQLDGNDVVYADREAADASLLTFTSTPLQTALEITGHPKVRFYLASSSPENALHVYLEAVTESGDVVYLTEGLLHTRHHRPSTGPAPYWTPDTLATGWRSYREADGRKMTPGQLTEVAFELLPTSAVVPKGARLRLAIAGADADSFERVPAAGGSILTLAYGGEKASLLELSSRPRPELDDRPAAAALSRFVGTYVFDQGGQVSVAEENGLLFLRPVGGAAFELVFPGSRRFSQYDQRTEELLGLVRNRDRKGAERLFAHPASADSLWSTLKPLRKAEHFQILGTANFAGMPATSVALGPSSSDGAEPEGVMLLLWTDSTGQLLLVVNSASASATRFVAVGRDRFEAFDVRPRRGGLQFQTDAAGEVTGLHLDGRKALRRVDD